MKPGTLAQLVIFEHGTNDPFIICKEKGIVVRREPLAEIRGYYIHVEGQDIITVASNLQELTARFVCAHELYHCEKHRHLNRVFMDRRTRMVSNHFENEADAFAYYFNFPCESAYMQFAEVSLPDMADCLNVGPDRVETRLEQILKAG